MSLELWKESRTKTTTQGLPPVDGPHGETESEDRWRQAGAKELFKASKVKTET